jgi:hypothetical protein
MVRGRLAIAERACVPLVAGKLAVGECRFV